MGLGRKGLAARDWVAGDSGQEARTRAQATHAVPSGAGPNLAWVTRPSWPSREVCVLARVCTLSSRVTEATTAPTTMTTATTQDTTVEIHGMNCIAIAAVMEAVANPQHPNHAHAVKMAADFAQAEHERRTEAGRQMMQDQINDMDSAEFESFRRAND